MIFQWRFPAAEFHRYAPARHIDSTESVKNHENDTIVHGDAELKIDGLIWFDDIVEKLIRKHNVQQSEVREILYNKPH